MVPTRTTAFPRRAFGLNPRARRLVGAALIAVTGLALTSCGGSEILAPPTVSKESPKLAAALAGLPVGPTLRSFTTAYTGPDHVATLTIARPAVQNGDVLVLFLASSATIDPSGLTGWTQVVSGNAGSSLRGRSYYRIAASEPASYTFTFASALHLEATLLAYSGVDTTNPISAYGVVQDGSYYTTMTSPALSGVGANDLVVIGFHARGTGEPTANPPTVGPFTFIPPASGWTEITQQTTTDADDPDVGMSVVQKVSGTDRPTESVSPTGFQFTRVTTALALRASTGTGTGPGVSLSPTSVTFGSQAVGTTSAAQPVTLNNTGGAMLTISSISITGTNSGDFAQTNNCGTSVAAGATCTINVTFTPTAPGTRAGTLTIADNASGSPHTAGLTGTGAGPGVSLSPPSVTFASQAVGTTSAAQPVTLSNTGGATLTISGISITGTNSGDFAQTNNCGTSVAAGATCTINVTYTPTATGTRTGTLTIADNASGSPHTAGLTGLPVGATLRSFTTADTGPDHLASVTIATPVVQNGDVLVLFLESSATIDPSGLNGWTQVDAGNAGSSLRGRSFYRIAASEPASYTFAFASAIHIEATMLAYSGVDTTNPISAHGMASGTSSYFTTMTSPALSGVGSNDLVVIGFQARGTGETSPPPPTLGPVTLIPPGSGWTEITQHTTTAPNNPNVAMSVVQKVNGIDRPTESASPTGFQFTRVITALALRALP